MLNTIKTFFTYTLPNHALSTLLRLLIAFAVVLIGFLLIKWTVKALKKIQSRSLTGSTAVYALLNTCLSITLKTVVLLIAATILGIPTTSAIAFLAIVGIAVALALQGSLKNAISGLLLSNVNAYQVGDFIETNGHSGTVVEIGLFHTKLITSDNLQVLLPNAVIADAPLIDRSKKETERLDLTVRVDRDASIDDVKALLSTLAQAHPLILKDPAPLARLDEITDVALVFAFRVWVNVSDAQTVKFDLTELIKKALDARHIPLPGTKSNTEK